MSIRDNLGGGTVLESLEEIAANTDEGKAAGALAVKELSESLDKVRTYVGEDGKLHFVDASGADSVLPFSSGTPYIDVRGLTSNTSHEYFDFSVSANSYDMGASPPEAFYKAVNGEGKTAHSVHGWYAGQNVTVTITLKKHIPKAFLLSVTGNSAPSVSLDVANLSSHTNIEMLISQGRKYLFKPTCGVGESFTLVFTSGYAWVSFWDFHLIAY